MLDRSLYNFRWTDENTAILKELWLAGKSSTQIQLSIGAPTRNTVSGKVDRLRLRNSDRDITPTSNLRYDEAGNCVPRQPRKPRKPQGGGLIQRRPTPQIVRPRRPEVIMVDPARNPVTIFGLGPGVCRWPMWSVDERPKTESAFYCANPCGTTEAYCSFHAAQSRGVTPPRNRSGAALPAPKANF
jgi:hypothetical protein